MHLLSCSTCDKTWPAREASVAMRTAARIVCPSVLRKAAVCANGRIAQATQELLGGGGGRTGTVVAHK